jgi:hypothetical protein
VLAAMLAMLVAMPACASAPAGRARILETRTAPTLVAFHSRFRSYGYRGISRGRPRHTLLRRAVKTAIWLYILHLFFSHGGLSVLLWIVIIGVVLSLVRRRRRRYAY